MTREGRVGRRTEVTVDIDIAVNPKRTSVGSICVPQYVPKRPGSSIPKTIRFTTISLIFQRSRKPADKGVTL